MSSKSLFQTLLGISWTKDWQQIWWPIFQNKDFLFSHFLTLIEILKMWWVKCFDFGCICSCVIKLFQMSNDLTLYPTLLHFSTYHGLDQLTSALLDCPGSQHALKVPNSNGQTPLDIANQAGHHDLAEILRAHQQDPPKLLHIYDYILSKKLFKTSNIQTCHHIAFNRLISGANL